LRCNVRVHPAYQFVIYLSADSILQAFFVQPNITVATELHVLIWIEVSAADAVLLEFLKKKNL
jgi:hypothetical protein